MAKSKSLLPFLVRRYLRFDKEQPFIFLSALLAFLGIALGVMVLMIAMALMNGMSKEFQKRLFVMNYPLTILPKFSSSLDFETYDQLKSQLPDLKYSPFIRIQAISRRSGQMDGGMLFGVDFKQEVAINSVLEKALGDKVPGKFQVIMGQTLFDNYALNLNDKLTYIFTDISANGFSLTPKMKRFKVAGTFESGLANYDKVYHYASLESVRKIKGWPEGRYTGIHVYSDKPMEDIKRLKEVLPAHVTVFGWWEQNGNFFAALELEKKALFIVLMLIILMAAINIISSLLMTVMNRRSEIALFISLGASETEVKKIFLYLGVIIGISGIFAGTILGLSGLWILSSFDIISLPADVYGTSRLPLELSVIDFISIIFGAFIIVVLSAWYPAKKAAQVDVLNVLRNE
jgi:putative ABC transport system permease protein